MYIYQIYQKLVYQQVSDKIYLLLCDHKAENPSTGTAKTIPMYLAVSTHAFYAELSNKVSQQFKEIGSIVKVEV